MHEETHLLLPRPAWTMFFLAECNARWIARTALGNPLRPPLSSLPSAPPPPHLAVAPSLSRARTYIHTCTRHTTLHRVPLPFSPPFDSPSIFQLALSPSIIRDSVEHWRSRGAGEGWGTAVGEPMQRGRMNIITSCCTRNCSFVFPRQRLRVSGSDRVLRISGRRVSLTDAPRRSSVGFRTGH